MKKVLIVLGVFLLAGVIAFFCLVDIDVEIIGTESGYDHLTEAQKGKVQSVFSLDSLKVDGNVYRVTANQMKSYLKGRGRVLVYSYIPYCHGRDCVTPQEALRKCQEAGVELVLIAELFDKLFENIADFPQPVFVIDAGTAGADDRETYTKLFYNGLIGPTGWSRLSGIYFLFDGGRYLRQYSSIDDALAK